ncbi:MAG: MBL fold metallo-hydrolase [Deltaproteobacteria bacterium]|nr:MBL fold metallo-hydrolase [Deltaproteobacteria bacterium]
MKLTVLVDNATLTDRYFLAEPGLCFHLVLDDGRGILLDAGYSDVFLRNAAKMGIDLRQVSTVVLSHGHLDHTWGLSHLAALLIENLHEGLVCKPPRVLCHPIALDDRRLPGLPQIGALLSPGKMATVFELDLSTEPQWLDENLLYLGEIERRLDFEATSTLGLRSSPDGEAPDDLLDDTALAYRSDQGLVILTGCSHAGICNIVEQARRLTGESRVRDIVGGLHLLDASRERLEATANYLNGLHLQAIHPCHCTDLASKIFLARTLPVKEVGVGLALQWAPAWSGREIFLAPLAGRV